MQCDDLTRTPQFTCCQFCHFPPLRWLFPRLIEGFELACLGPLQLPLCAEKCQRNWQGRICVSYTKIGTLLRKRLPHALVFKTSQPSLFPPPRRPQSAMIGCNRSSKTPVLTCITPARIIPGPFLVLLLCNGRPHKLWCMLKEGASLKTSSVNLHSRAWHANRLRPVRDILKKIIEKQSKLFSKT